MSIYQISFFLKLSGTFIVLFLLYATSMAQLVRGKVIDANTGLPLINASVFLNGTYQMVATDSTGAFKIPVSDYRVPLVISYVGYETQQIENYTDVALNIALKHKINLLNEVTVTSDDGMGRKAKMKRFLEEFIGADQSDCVIVNPDDIWLHYNKQSGELTAGSDKPLIINNKKLGYKITYFLAMFSSVPLRTTYRGNYIFTEDTVSLKHNKIIDVLKNRQIAYLGSRMHFIRSLCADKLEMEGFKLYRPRSSSLNVSVYYLEHSEKLNSGNIVEFKNDSLYRHQKFIVLGSEIAILYEPKGRPTETSFVKTTQGHEGTYIFINSDGNCGEELEWKGNMGLARVGKLLPYEFVPIEKAR